VAAIKCRVLNPLSQFAVVTQYASDAQAEMSGVRIHKTRGDAPAVAMTVNEPDAVRSHLPALPDHFGQWLSANVVRVITMQWPAPGSEDTELGVLMEPEVAHGEAEVYAGVQA
jgi:hypothetical protein